MSLLQLLETEGEEAKRRISARYARNMAEANGWRKPPFGTMLYRESQNRGWITPEEADADRQIREARAARTGQQKRAGWSSLARLVAKSSPPLRWFRETPIPSNQYAPAMATRAARDDRLTPQAKALLQIIHARCGGSGMTQTTKGTLANIMSRCARSIQRYLCELQRFGYIAMETRRGKTGLYCGLVIRITRLAQPFFDDVAKCAEWLCKTFTAENMPFALSEGPNSCGFSEETTLSPKNQPIYSTRKNRSKSEKFWPQKNL